jgi:iron complex transport system substrate-binding protein
MRIRHLALALLLLLAVVLGACGGGDDDGSATASAAAPAPDAAAFPVTITQKTGTVTIRSAPTRVVALDFPSADAAIALGVTPVGMYDVTYVEGGIQSWTKARLGSAHPQLLDTDKGFPFEKIAALHPDVILATNTYPLVADSYDKLSAIAPVVTHVDAPGVDTWQQGMLQVGKALGRQAEAEQLIASAEAKVAAAKAQHPEFAGKTLAFFNYVAGDGLYAVSSDDDFSIKFLTELGFAGVAPAIARLKGADGRAQVSPERYELLDAGMVMGTSPDPAALATLRRDPLFAHVPAVAQGHYVGLGIGPATAMAFPSVLSVPYAVDTLVPKLAAALR